MNAIAYKDTAQKDVQKDFVSQKGDEMTEVVTSLAANVQLNLLAPRQQVFVVEPQTADAGFAVADLAPTAVDTQSEQTKFSDNSGNENPVNRHKDDAAQAPRPEPVSGPSRPRIEIKHIDLGLTPSEVVGTPDILQRFDTNGDGRVDLIEAARAGVAREGVFTFAGLGVAQTSDEATTEVPATQSPSVGAPTAAPADAAEAVSKKLFVEGDAPATKRFHAQVAEAHGAPSGVADAPKKLYGQGAEVVLGKFVVTEQTGKFADEAKPTVTITEDGSGEVQAHDKVAQTDTDNAPADADAKQQNPEASPKNAAQIAAYAEAAAVVKAAAKAVTA